MQKKIHRPQELKTGKKQFKIDRWQSVVMKEKNSQIVDRFGLEKKIQKNYSLFTQDVLNDVLNV